MKAHYAHEVIPYTGDQLRSLWIYRTFGISGDAIVGFVGPCDVRGDRLVDQVDAVAGEYICSADMMHFIVEHFDGDLEHAILRQRLLVCLAADILRPDITNLRRVGDDLFVGDRKLSVSIATISPVSTLVHFGVNIDATGAPVAACGLQEFHVDWWQFAERLGAAYVAEMESVEQARCTTRGVP